jgi:hypothetical protein
MTPLALTGGGRLAYHGGIIVERQEATMAEKFEGFANAEKDEDGKFKDFRDVPAYDADRDEAVKAPSSIVQFKSNDKATNGSPSAVVVPKSPASEPDTDLDEVVEDPDVEPDEDKTAEAAEGKEDSES